MILNYCFAIGGVIVDSAHCLQEEVYDRPTAAYLNFCPQALSTDPAHFDTQQYLVLKELIHSLVNFLLYLKKGNVTNLLKFVYMFRHFLRFFTHSTITRGVILVQLGMMIMANQSCTLMGKSHV